MALWVDVVESGNYSEQSGIKGKKVVYVVSS